MLKCFDLFTLNKGPAVTGSKKFMIGFSVQEMFFSSILNIFGVSWFNHTFKKTVRVTIPKLAPPTLFQNSNSNYGTNNLMSCLIFNEYFIFP